MKTIINKRAEIKYKIRMKTELIVCQTGKEEETLDSTIQKLNVHCRIQWQ